MSGVELRKLQEWEGGGGLLLKGQNDAQTHSNCGEDERGWKNVHAASGPKTFPGWRSRVAYHIKLFLPTGDKSDCDPNGMTEFSSDIFVGWASASGALICLSLKNYSGERGGWRGEAVRHQTAMNSQHSTQLPLFLSYVNNELAWHA